MQHNGNLSVLGKLQAADSGGVSRGEYVPFNPENLVAAVTLTATNISNRPLIYPFVLNYSLTHNELQLEVSRAAAASNLFTFQAALYTYVNSTLMSRLASLQNSYSNTATASVSGVRDLRATGWEAAGSALAPGNYALMIYMSAAATASMNYIVMGVAASGAVGIIRPGTDNVTTATAQLSSLAHFNSFAGRYTVSTASPPSLIGLSDLLGYSSHSQIWWAMRST